MAKPCIVHILRSRAVKGDAYGEYRENEDESAGACNECAGGHDPYPNHRNLHRARADGAHHGYGRGRGQVFRGCVLVGMVLG